MRPRLFWGRKSHTGTGVRLAEIGDQRGSLIRPVGIPPRSAAARNRCATAWSCQKAADKEQKQVAEDALPG